MRELGRVEGLSLSAIRGQGTHLMLQRTTSMHGGGVHWVGDENAGRTVATEHIAVDDEFLFRGHRLRQRGRVTASVGERSGACQNHDCHNQSEVFHIGPHIESPIVVVQMSVLIWTFVQFWWYLSSEKICVLGRPENQFFRVRLINKREGRAS